MAILTDEDRATRIAGLQGVLARLDDEIAVLQAERAPYAEALAALTDAQADYEVTLIHGDGRERVVVQHGDSKEGAARLAMNAHPGFTANHAKTTAIPKDLPDLLETAPRAAAGQTGGAIPLGPTIEEYVKAGYHPDTYPPHGFAAVDSPGLQRYQAGESVFATPPPSTPSAPPPQAPQTGGV